MSFKECQGLKALAAHLSTNVLLSAPPPGGEDVGFVNNRSSILLSFEGEHAGSTVTGLSDARLGDFASFTLHNYLWEKIWKHYGYCFTAQGFCFNKDYCLEMIKWDALLALHVFVVPSPGR